MFDDCASVDDINIRWSELYWELDCLHDADKYWEMSELARRAYERFPAIPTAFERDVANLKMHRTTVALKCATCGESFEAASGTRMYCSRECFHNRNK